MVGFLFILLFASHLCEDRGLGYYFSHEFFCFMLGLILARWSRLLVSYYVWTGS
jgi:hypothetical protein